MASQQADRWSIVLLLAALIAYGSLYPFEFVWRPIGTDGLLSFLTDWRSSKADVVGNIALFLPYGFAGALSLKAGRSRLRTAAIVLLPGLLLAIGLQILQLWIPGRVPRLSDAALNLIGMLSGMIIAEPFRRFGWQSSSGDFRRSYLSIPMSLVALWIAYRWFPLVPSLDLQHLKDAVKPLLKNPSLDAVRTVHDTIAWLACFHLVRRTPLFELRPLAVSGLAFSVLLAEPLFVSNYISLNNVVGLGIAASLQPLLARASAPVWLILSLFAAVALSGLTPFELAEPGNSFYWLPFAGFLNGSMWVNTASLLEKCFFYGTIVYLLHDEGAPWGPAATIVGIWLALLETAQIFIAGRTAEITDPLLPLLIAYIMSRFARSESKHPPRLGAGSQSSARSSQMHRRVKS